MKRIALVLLISLPAGAQVGGLCTPINTVNFCVNEQTDGLPSSIAERNERFGAALAFGDFDGNGFPDLAVGIPGDQNGRGAVHIYGGSASNTRIAPLILTQDTIPGQTARSNEEFGYALAAGDLDGDGIDDLAISAPSQSTYALRCGDQFGTYPCLNDGVVHVYRGSGGGLQTTGVLTIGIGDVDATFTVAGQGLRFGHALAIGDLNGDGFAELAIGTPYSGGGFLGRNAGAGGIVVLPGSSIGVRLTQPDFIPGLARGTSQQEANQGTGPMRIAVVAGVPQLIVGQPLYDEQGHEDSGAVLTYRFDAGLPLPRRYVLTTVLRQTSYGLAGQSSGDHFGLSLDVGDFNGDGLIDLIAGAPGKTLTVGGQNMEDGGRAYVVYGSATGFNTSNIQVFDQSVFPGQSAQANDGYTAALAAGDISGDGIDDVVLGAPGESSSDTGFFYFLVGSPQRLRLAEPTPIFGGGYNASQLTIGGSNGQDDHFGGVLAVADVTGDGQAEIAVGVPDKEVAGHTDAGMVYVTRRLQRLP